MLPNIQTFAACACSDRSRQTVRNGSPNARSAGSKSGLQYARLK